MIRTALLKKEVAQSRQCLRDGNCMRPQRFNRQPMAADEEITMDKDRVKGAAKNTTGKMKEAAGKMTGDTKMQAEGKMDRASGKVQNAVGGAKDAMKK